MRVFVFFREIPFAKETKILIASRETFFGYNFLFLLRPHSLLRAQFGGRYRLHQDLASKNDTTSNLASGPRQPRGERLLFSPPALYPATLKEEEVKKSR